LTKVAIREPTLLVAVVFLTLVTVSISPGTKLKYSKPVETFHPHQTLSSKRGFGGDGGIREPRPNKFNLSVDVRKPNLFLLWHLLLYIQSTCT
jgi:hypothetical protein